MLSVLLVAASCGTPAKVTGDVFLLAAPKGSAAGSAAVMERSLVVRSAAGPAAPATTQTVAASCPAGSVLVGGGVSTLLANGGQPTPSLHANGLYPGADGAWIAQGATGGQLALGGQTTDVAICVRGGPSVVRVVVGRTAGPSKAATTAAATAVCPTGTVLVGGGGLADVSPPAPSLHLTGSYPSGNDGSFAASGSAAGAWTAVADAGGRGGPGVTTIAFALCGRGGPVGATQVVAVTEPGPTTPATAVVATATCPAGSTLLSGGANVGLLSRQFPQRGIHLTGSFPSDPRGTAVRSSGNAANSWSARSETGGQSAPGITTSGFAICTK